jgi:hypothetical protein
MALFPNTDKSKTVEKWQSDDVEELLATILRDNPSIKNTFIFPLSEKRVDFNVHAPRYLFGIETRGDLRDCSKWSPWLKKADAF